MNDMTPRDFETMRAAIGEVEEVAAMMEVGRVTIYRWETGKRAIPGPARVLIRLLHERHLADLEAERKQVARSAKLQGKAK